MDLEKESKNLMWLQTHKNTAPAWALTQLAIQKGKELAKANNVDTKLVISSLYLAHTIFSPIWMGEIQKNHPQLSAEFIEPYLKKWNVPKSKQKIILNAIRAHHNKESTESIEAEVVKNAECFKFVTLQGSLIWLHECGRRGYSFEESVQKVLIKMEQKIKLLTFPDCIKEAKKNKKEILKVFSI